MRRRDRQPSQPVAPGGAGAGRSLEEVLSAVEASVELVEVAAGVFAGPNVTLPGYRRLFGGQLLAQALAVARAPGKLARSLHLVFVAEGSPDTPVAWAAEPVHDGRTFATRSVVALQGERLLATGLVSLHTPEGGGRLLDHSIRPPRVPPPDELAAAAQIGAMAFDIRPAPLGEPLAQPALDGLALGPPELAVWMRAPRAPRDRDQLLQQELLAYVSDLTMMAVAMRPHEGVGFGSPVLEASAVTSHTISFHRPLEVAEWLLFVQQSPAAAAGRAYVRGDFFDGSGTVVASCAQEVLIRVASD